MHIIHIRSEILPTNLTTYTPCQGEVSFSQVARCHGQAFSRRVAYGRVSGVPMTMVVQNVLSTTACPFQPLYLLSC